MRSAPATARAQDRSTAPGGSQGSAALRAAGSTQALPSCTGHNGLFQPSFWEGKVRGSVCEPHQQHWRRPSISLWGRREAGSGPPSPAAASPAPAPRALAGLFPASHALGSMAWDAGEAPGGGSSTAHFPLHRQGISLCGAGAGAFQCRAAPAPQPSLPCRAIRAGSVRPGTGAALGTGCWWSPGFKGLGCAWRSLAGNGACVEQHRTRPQ